MALRIAVRRAASDKLMPPGSAQRLTDALLRSPDFQLVFRDGDAYVFKLVPRGTSQERSAAPQPS